MVSCSLMADDSLSRAAYHAASSDAAADLDNHLEGIVAYGLSTANTPEQRTYGLCLAFANVKGDAVAPGRWVTQISLPTSGYPMFRRKINQGEWTTWLPMKA